MPTFTAESSSPLALRAKAAALFERATRVASQNTPGTFFFLSENVVFMVADYYEQSGNIDNVYVEFHRLDNLLKRFMEALLPLNRPEVATNPEATASLLVTHTYIRVAMIRLHASRDAVTSNHQGDDLIAARQVAALLASVRLEDLPFLDPVLGVSVFSLRTHQYSKTRFPLK